MQRREKVPGGRSGGDHKPASKSPLQGTACAQYPKKQAVTTHVECASQLTDAGGFDRGRSRRHLLPGTYPDPSQKEVGVRAKP